MSKHDAWRDWRMVATGVVLVALAAAVGALRDLWWLWLLWWCIAEVGGAVSNRLIYWQRRRIAALEEAAVLDGRDHP